MKIFGFLLVLAMWNVESGYACPGAGYIELVSNGKKVATLDTYSATLRVQDGYALESATSRSSAKSPGGQSSWAPICDSRSGKEPCHRMERKDGAYVIPKNHYGLRDLKVSLKTEKAPRQTLREFQIEAALIDPNQPHARDISGCGRTVSNTDGANDRAAGNATYGSDPAERGAGSVK